MATRSMIGIENSDGTIEAIYCHCDGAPEDKGPVLTAFYDSEKKVRELIALGDLSILGEEIGEQHDFDEHWRYLMAHPFRIWCLMAVTVVTLIQRLLCLKIGLIISQNKTICTSTCFLVGNGFFIPRSSRHGNL